MRGTLSNNSLQPSCYFPLSLSLPSGGMSGFSSAGGFCRRRCSGVNSPIPRSAAGSGGGSCGGIPNYTLQNPRSNRSRIIEGSGGGILEDLGISKEKGLIMSRGNLSGTGNQGTENQGPRCGRGNHDVVNKLMRMGMGYR
jgi:hypothetical protein